MVRQHTTWTIRGVGLSTQLRRVLLCVAALLLVWPLCICVTPNAQDIAKAIGVNGPLTVVRSLADEPSDNAPSSPLAYCAFPCTSQVISSVLVVGLLTPLLKRRLPLAAVRPYPCTSAPPLLPPPQFV